MADFMIGATYGGMAYFKDLTVAMKEPRADPMDYAKMITLGDGTDRGVGQLVQIWHWGFMSEAQRNALEEFIGPVYVRTLQNDGTFGVFTAELAWPKKEPEHYAKRVIDISLELRKLKAYTI
jgi:hypothetical protein